VSCETLSLQEGETLSLQVFHFCMILIDILLALLSLVYDALTVFFANLYRPSLERVKPKTFFSSAA
jgi:hypothetical protein